MATKTKLVAVKVTPEVAEKFSAKCKTKGSTSSQTLAMLMEAVLSGDLALWQ